MNEPICEKCGNGEGVAFVLHPDGMGGWEHVGYRCSCESDAMTADKLRPWPSERWRVGDVIRSTDPDDKRIWGVDEQWGVPPRPFRLIGSDGGSGVRRFARGDLPERLVLLVRDGSTDFTWGAE